MTWRLAFSIITRASSHCFCQNAQTVLKVSYNEPLLQEKDFGSHWIDPLNDLSGCRQSLQKDLVTGVGSMTCVGFSNLNCMCWCFRDVSYLGNWHTEIVVDVVFRGTSNPWFSGNFKTLEDLIERFVIGCNLEINYVYEFLIT